MEGRFKLTGSVEVLVVLLRKAIHLKPKRHDLATNLPDLLLRILDRAPEPEVLRDAPDGLLLAQRLVPGQQLRGRRHVLRDGLLAQHVLARGERLLDDLGLREDGQGDDDGVDVGAGQERVEGVGGGGRLVVDVGRGLGGVAEGLG